VLSRKKTLPFLFSFGAVSLPFDHENAASSPYLDGKPAGRITAKLDFHSC
jgi:hypothetical protein